MASSLTLRVNVSFRRVVLLFDTETTGSWTRSRSWKTLPSPQTIRKVAALGQSWGRSKELRNSSFERFVEILLPMPTMTAENFQKCQQVMKKRLQLVSPAPKLTGELFDQAMELLEANDRQVKAFLALVRSGVDEIGPDVVRGLAEILS